MDGDPATYFRSAYGMDDGDEFRVILSRPMAVRGLAVVTGDADGNDLLTDGVVETSSDGVTFSPAASFNSLGVAEGKWRRRRVAALRIRLTPRHGIPALLVREITVNASEKIAHVQTGPGRGFADISRAPQVAAWAAKAEQQMEAFWPDTAALLYSDGFITPNMVNVVYRTGPNVTGVAATGGGVMTVNTAWCEKHPDDTGLTVHEMAHVVQSMSAYNPVWLIEGTADYIRWVKFEPEHFRPRINVLKATYHDSYQTTATFLAWCELHYDGTLVTKMNRAIRQGKYTSDLWKQYTGKDVDTLWAEFLVAYTADPKNVMTAPVAAADRPRVLPVVAPGSSVPVDVASAFDAAGIARDGSVTPTTGGVDGEGSTYSAKLLGVAQSYKNVDFKLGPANAPDLVTANGNVIALPSGSFASLWLLGSAVEGSQVAQTFTVTYTDGTAEVLVQSLSDWFQPKGFPGESRAVKMAYRDTSNGAMDSRPFYLYSYGFTLNIAKMVKSITLPNNPYVKVFAVTVAK